MSGAGAGPAAYEITPAQTLELLDRAHADFALGVAEGRYVFWLGSGISRDRLPDLGKLILKVLTFLHARIDSTTMTAPTGRPLRRQWSLRSSGRGSEKHLGSRTPQRPGR